MNNLPPFLIPVFASLEPICTKAMEYETSALGPKELFTKIASDVGPMADPVKELIDVSTKFRNMFKEAALKDGRDEAYVRGAFDEAETICKLAVYDMML